MKIPTTPLTQEAKPDTSNVYSPERAVNNTLSVIQKRVDNPKSGIRQHIPEAGEILAPWHAGELIALVGYTSNGKSSFANYIATQVAYNLRSYQREDPSYKHVVVYVTWEQAIEEQTIHDLSRVTSIDAKKIFNGELTQDELDRIYQIGATDRKSIPIWLIGSSIKDSRSRVRFSMDHVINGLDFIESMGYSIDLIFLDYLQRIKRRGSLREMREGFVENVDMAKDLAIRCPAVLLSQAGRQVLKRSWQLPRLDDGQETSNLEQSSQAYISIWMPKQSGRRVIFQRADNPLGWWAWDVTPNLAVVGYLKQTQGPAPVTRMYQLGFGGVSLEVDHGRAPTDEELKKLKGRKSDI